jgi:hypothetical protein
MVTRNPSDPSCSGCTEGEHTLEIYTFHPSNKHKHLALAFPVRSFLRMSGGSLVTTARRDLGLPLAETASKTGLQALMY